MDEKYPEMYEWSKHFHENLYLLILIDLSYYLRCQFVHGNVTNLTTYEAMGDFNKAVALANFFMDRFLTDNLPDFLMSEEMDDDIFDMCRKWLYKRRKNQSPFNRPEGFLDYIYSITRENGNSTNETVE